MEYGNKCRQLTTPTPTPYTTSYSSHALTETGPARPGLPSWIGAGVTVSPIPTANQGTGASRFSLSLWPGVLGSHRTRSATSHSADRKRKIGKIKKRKEKRKRKGPTKGRLQRVVEEERRSSPISIYLFRTPTAHDGPYCGSTFIIVFSFRTTDRLNNLGPWRRRSEIMDRPVEHSECTTSLPLSGPGPLPEVPSGGKKGAR
ncbi:hypothetical protein BDV10DRAFT_30832 [Aspergillus recurvatus]